MLIIFFILSGTRYLQGQEKAIVEKIYIDPAYARGGTASEVFDTVAFIPLETTKESLFGEIWKMELTDDYYVIFDQNTNAILVFQKNGKFHAKITGKMLKGHIASNFTVDQEQKLIALSVSSIPKKLIWMDFDGKIIRKTDTPEPSYSFASLNAATILYSPWAYLKKDVKADSTNYRIKYLKNAAIGKGFLPFKVKPAGIRVMSAMQRPNYFYYSGIRNNLLFIGENDYNIQALNDSGLQKVYRVIFPLELSLPADFQTNPLYTEKKEVYLRENHKIIQALRNAYIARNHLFFETLMGYFSNSDSYLGYNLKTRNIISLGRVTSDNSTYFLPLIKGSGGIAGSDNEYIYSAISSLDMFGQMEANKSRHLDYPPGLQTYFAKQSRKSNQVIVKLRLKDNF